MISESAKRTLREGIYAWSSSILVQGKLTEEDIKTFFNDEKACAAFVGGYRMQYSPAWTGIFTRIEFSYINQGFTVRDVSVATNIAAVNGTLCQAVANYKEGVVLIAPKILPVTHILGQFYHRFGVFYANYTGTSYAYFDSPFIPYTIFYIKISYRIDRAVLANMERQTQAEIERLKALLFTPRMPDVAKAYLAHNYLALTVKYFLTEGADAAELSLQQSAYGALIRKQCVCQGYAEAFKRLMDAAGIPCVVVCGQVVGSDGYHAWNIIRLNGGTDGYHVDVTWDISNTTPNYTYFGKNDGFFAGKRTWDKGCYFLCYKSADIKAQAQTYIRMNKEELLRKGIPSAILDV